MLFTYSRTGQEKRSFPPPDEYVTWPVFRWSKDDRYFARLGQDVLSVYETPSFGLLDKKSIKIPGIRYVLTFVIVSKNIVGIIISYIRFY